jgi:predicted  nucleic acid-binding Zn-ribbon protein
MTASEQLKALDKRVREIERRLAEHQGKTDANWDHQNQHNLETDDEARRLRKHIDEKFAAVFKRLALLEGKVAVFAAAAAAGGSMVAKYLLP